MKKHLCSAVRLGYHGFYRSVRQLGTSHRLTDFQCQQSAQAVTSLNSYKLNNLYVQKCTFLDTNRYWHCNYGCKNAGVRYSSTLHTTINENGGNEANTDSSKPDVLTATGCLMEDSISDSTEFESLKYSLKLEDATNIQKSVLDPPARLEDIDDVAPQLPPSFNMAAYVNKSATLQELVKLGIDLSKFDRNLYKARYVLSLDFERDVRPHLLFLHSLTVPADEWGRLLTINPYLLKEDISVLKTRVQYLTSKKFDAEMVARIVSRYPPWLSTRVISIDEKLGFLQKHFKLIGDELRTLATKLPRLVTYEARKIEERSLLIGNDYGFTSDQMRQMIIGKPKIWQTNIDDLKQRLHLLLNKMNVTHEHLATAPEILGTKTLRLDNRHYFLRSLGRAQYDPTLPNYVSLKLMTLAPDPVFAVDYARSTVLAYNTFLKTL